MTFAYQITVFTPTYNRAHIIEKLFRSLQRQTFLNFEWLVVDDGSSDETEQLLARWSREETRFPIRCFRQENGGKCRAINRGLELARGRLFFTVDSDDYLTDDALEKISRWEAALPRDGHYCGLAGNLGTAPDTTPNRPFDGGFFDGSALDRYGAVDGERAMVFYTDIHRRYPYPEFSGEKFMTEAVAWNRMAGDGWKMRFFNDIIWVYAYKEDGLTQAGKALFLRNPRGYGLWLREKAKLTGYAPSQVLQMWYGYACDLAFSVPPEQIAEDIGMPRWLVKPMWNAHKLAQRIKKKN